ncbi:MAG: response regulator [Candidatus Auribacterota bacterium]|nr:response regulator [Candidatus Auribacterota bacterium]
MKKVLIIEDSAADAAIIKDILCQYDLIVETAMDGEEGFEKARSGPPDLILLDLILPGIDGYEVCRRIKKEDSLRKAVVVVLSVRDTVEDITRAFQAGADDYIIKPPWPEIIAKKIKLYLGLH